MNPPINPAQLYNSSKKKSNTNTPNINNNPFDLLSFNTSSTNTPNLDTISQSSTNSYMIPNLMNNNQVELPPPPIPETINYKETLRRVSLKNFRYPDINSRLVILDAVTTGDDPKNNNIIEIGCYEMINGHCTGRQFHGFLHPRFDIDEFTEQKIANNVYIDFTKDGKESDCIVLENFVSFVGDSKIVVHNVDLNMTFLNREFAYHKLKTLPDESFYCTLTMFKFLFPDINTKATIDELLIFYSTIIKKERKKIRCSDNICSLLKCCEYLRIKVPKKTHFSAKFGSFIVSKLMARIFVIVDEVKRLHIKIRERLLNKKMLNAKNKSDKPENNGIKDIIGTNGISGTNNISELISNSTNDISTNNDDTIITTTPPITTSPSTTTSTPSTNGTSNKPENNKFIRSIYQDIYSDGKRMDEQKFDNIMELIEKDYKNMDHSYYNQFKSHKVNNELCNIMDNHNNEMRKIQRGQRINGIDLNTLRNKNRRRRYYKYSPSKKKQKSTIPTIPETETLLAKKRDLETIEQK